MRFSLLTLGDNYEQVRSHEQFYQEVIEEGQHAEELGFDGFWIGEHHFQASQRVFPSPQMVLTAIAQRTKRIRLGTGVTVLPVNDPIRIAEDIAALDLISHGRACFGVGRGYQPHEFAGFNIAAETTKQRLWECLEVIRLAWTQERFSYHGKFYHYDDLGLLPRPLQKPTPPIWVAAASPGSAQEAARRGYAFSAVPFASGPSPQEVGDQLTRYRQTYVAAGHGEPPDDIPHVFWSHITESTEQALREADAGMKKKLGGSTKVWVKPGVSGYETFAKVGQFLATATIEQIDTMAIFGDPERCVERVRQYQAVGVNHIMVMFDWGGMPQKTVFHSMDLFAKYVMPQFREVASNQTTTVGIGSQSELRTQS